MTYDMVCRRDWAEKTAAGVPGFQASGSTLPACGRPSPRATTVQVAAAAIALDPDLLRAAENYYDRAESAR